MVHCSAGIGRSGTFCLVDSCLRMVAADGRLLFPPATFASFQIKELRLDNVVIRDVLIEMRHFRMGLVQTPDQLRFSYLAILEGLKPETAVNGSAVRISYLFF